MPSRKRSGLSGTAFKDGFQNGVRLALRTQGQGAFEWAPLVRPARGIPAADPFLLRNAPAPRLRRGAAQRGQPFPIFGAALDVERRECLPPFKNSPKKEAFRLASIGAFCVLVAGTSNKPGCDRLAVVLGADPAFGQSAVCAITTRPPCTSFICRMPPPPAPKPHTKAAHSLRSWAPVLSQHTPRTACGPASPETRAGLSVPRIQPVYAGGVFSVLSVATSRFPRLHKTCPPRAHIGVCALTGDGHEDRHFGAAT